MDPRGSRPVGDSTAPGKNAVGPEDARATPAPTSSAPREGRPLSDAEAFQAWLEAQDRDAPLPRLEDLHGNPLLLEMLATYDRASAVRAPFVFKVYFEHPGTGDRQYVQRNWTHEIPTEDAIARLIGNGSLPSGAYIVCPRYGRKPLGEIRVVVMAAMSPAAGASPTAAAPSSDLLERILARLAPQFQPPPLLQAPQIPADLVARVEALEDGLEKANAEIKKREEEHQELVDLVAATVSQVQEAMKEAGEDSPLGILDKVLDRFTSKETVPANGHATRGRSASDGEAP